MNQLQLNFFLNARSPVYSQTLRCTDGCFLGPIYIRHHAQIMQQPLEAYINAIGRAVPVNSAPQDVTAQFMADMLECTERLWKFIFSLLFSSFV